MKTLRQYINEEATEMFEKFDCEQVRQLVEKGIDLKKLDTDYVDVRVYKDDSFYPSAYVEIDFTREKDWPNHIRGNACLFEFYIDLETGKLEYKRGPRMWLSPFDKSGENPYDRSLKYMAMRGGADLGKECGIAKFRTCPMKDEKNVAKKVCEYVNKIMELVKVYTGGYPFKNGILDISIADAYKNR